MINGPIQYPTNGQTSYSGEKEKEKKPRGSRGGTILLFRMRRSQSFHKFMTETHVANAD
jgi:hypothetical protein